MSKETDLVRRAQELARSVTTWADLSNALFDPLDGLLALAFPAAEERRLFVRTKEFEQIQGILEEAVERFGLVEGANPTKLSGFMRLSNPTAADQSPHHIDSVIEAIGPRSGQATVKA